jgi:polyhydroxyalkanoate synthesis repressor PhaR
MAGEQPTIIKKYANRRLYHTGTSTYVTLEDLARMVKEGEDFVVTDAKTGEDITRAVLGQIIFEQEGRGQHLLPIAFLRQLIRFYGDQMQTLLPTYLESSLSAFTHNRDKLREQMARAFTGDSLGLIEEQTRRNMEMFSEAMRLWMPFAAGAADAGGAATPKNSDGAGEGGAKSETRDKELESLRRQLAEMQKTLDNIAGRK